MLDSEAAKNLTGWWVYLNLHHLFVVDTTMKLLPAYGTNFTQPIDVIPEVKTA